MVADRTLHAQLNSRPEASPPRYRRKSGCVQLPPPPSLVTRHFSDRTTGQGRASHIPEGREARSNRTGDRRGFAIRCPGGFRRMRRGTRGVRYHHRHSDARGPRFPRLRRVRDDSSADLRKGRREVQDTLRNHPKRPVAGNRWRPVLRVRRQPPRPRGRELRALRTTRGRTPRLALQGVLRGHAPPDRPILRSRTSTATGTIP